MQNTGRTKKKHSEKSKGNGEVVTIIIVMAVAATWQQRNKNCKSERKGFV